MEPVHKYSIIISLQPFRSYANNFEEVKRSAENITESIRRNCISIFDFFLLPFDDKTGFSNVRMCLARLTLTIHINCVGLGSNFTSATLYISDIDSEKIIRAIYPIVVNL